MKNAIAALALAMSLSVSASGQPQASAEKEQAIREYLELTHQADVGVGMVEDLRRELRIVYPQVPDSIWAEFSTTLDPVEAQGLLVQLYDRHFSLAELRAITEFYRTPVGQQIVEKMPALMQEVGKVSQQWADVKVEAVIRGLDERGYQPSAP